MINVKAEPGFARCCCSAPGQLARRPTQGAHPTGGDWRAVAERPGNSSSNWSPGRLPYKRRARANLYNYHLNHNPSLALSLSLSLSLTLPSNPLTLSLSLSLPLSMPSNPLSLSLPLPPSSSILSPSCLKLDHENNSEALFLFTYHQQAHPGCHVKCIN